MISTHCIFAHWTAHFASFPGFDVTIINFAFIFSGYTLFSCFDQFWLEVDFWNFQILDRISLVFINSPKCKVSRWYGLGTVAGLRRTSMSLSSDMPTFCGKSISSDVLGPILFVSPDVLGCSPVLRRPGP